MKLLFTSAGLRPRHGQRGSAARPVPSTMQRRSRWSTARSGSCRKGNGGSFRAERGAAAAPLFSFKAQNHRRQCAKHHRRGCNGNGTLCKAVVPAGQGTIGMLGVHTQPVPPHRQQRGRGEAQPSAFASHCRGQTSAAAQHSMKCRNQIVKAVRMGRQPFRRCIVTRHPRAAGAAAAAGRRSTSSSHRRPRQQPGTACSAPWPPRCGRCRA